MKDHSEDHKRTVDIYGEWAGNFNVSYFKQEISADDLRAMLETYHCYCQTQDKRIIINTTSIGFAMMLKLFRMIDQTSGTEILATFDSFQLSIRNNIALDTAVFFVQNESSRWKAKWIHDTQVPDDWD